jgi:hypothetical protein
MELLGYLIYAKLNDMHYLAWMIDCSHQEWVITYPGLMTKVGKDLY